MGGNGDTKRALDHLLGAAVVSKNEKKVGQPVRGKHANLAKSFSLNVQKPTAWQVEGNRVSQAPRKGSSRYSQ